MSNCLLSNEALMGVVAVVVVKLTGVMISSNWLMESCVVTRLDA